MVKNIFNVLNPPTESQIEFDRIQKGLTARQPLGDPPRDVICCLPDFTLKEDILFKVRGRDDIVYEETLRLPLQQ